MEKHGAVLKKEYHENQPIKSIYDTSKPRWCWAAFTIALHLFLLSASL